MAANAGISQERGRMMPFIHICQRRDTPENWESENPVLEDGEIGYERMESGIIRAKMGNGETPWNDLPYMDGGNLGGVYNSFERVTVSGTWTAKVSGFHFVKVIGGGSGGYCVQKNANFVVAMPGASGSVTRALVYMTKGQEVDVVIGAGGQPVTADPDSSSCSGGVTHFGEINSAQNPTYFTAVNLSTTVPNTQGLNGGGSGPGGGGRATTNVDAVWYGGGGGAVWAPTVEPKLFAGHGYQGCVEISYYDPDKAGGE